MKLKGLKRIIYTGYKDSTKSYEYSAFAEDMIYKFKVVDLSKDGYSIFSKDNKFNIIYDFELISEESRVLAENVDGKKPDQVICEYLEFDYDKYKNDIYVSVDKDYIMDYLKLGTCEYDISLPIENIYTPNTNWSHSDTILALIDKEYEHNLEQHDDTDFARDIFSHVLDLPEDYTYLNEYSSSLINYMFHKFMSLEDKEKLNNRELDFDLRPSSTNFERNFKQYDYEYNFKTILDEPEDGSGYTEKIELTIKYNPKDKPNYSNYDSDTMNAAGLVMSGLATVFALKSAMNMIKKK